MAFAHWARLSGHCPLSGYPSSRYWHTPRTAPEQVSPFGQGGKRDPQIVTGPAEAEGTGFAVADVTGLDDIAVLEGIAEAEGLLTAEATLEGDEEAGRLGGSAVGILADELASAVGVGFAD